ncbi:MAG: hypothetical protein HZC40_16360 [Chloroflexi bacterium]|nr:hypothetical protein [Chloroflexota bacterium]
MFGLFFHAHHCADFCLRLFTNFFCFLQFAFGAAKRVFGRKTRFSFLTIFFFSRAQFLIGNAIGFIRLAQSDLRAAQGNDSGDGKITTSNCGSNQHNFKDTH